jgi:deoxyadenosine/deoxycytidine kinase
MSALEWELYRRLYVELLHSPVARPPKLLVYLHAPLETIVERIQTRGRPKEKETAERYWEALHGRYERWIAEFRACPVLSLDVRGYDLVADPLAIEEIAARVRQRIEPDLPQTDLFPTALSRRASVSS